MRRLLFLLFFLPSISFAEDYYWTGGIPAGKHFSSPSAACYSLDNAIWGSPGSYWKVVGMTRKSEIEFTCLRDAYYPGVSNPSIRNHTAPIKRAGDSCPPNTEYNSETGECVPPEPEPENCKAGETIAAKKFIASGYVPGWAPTIAFEGCELKHKGMENCVFPYSKTLEDGSVVIGSMCDVVYEYSGEKLDQGGSMDLPDKPEDDTDATKDNTKDCNRFTNADGSWGYDCNPRPDPENNSCPPGYTIQGTTCFRIPPGHPDYDESKDPQKPGNNGGSGNNNGGNNGDSGDKPNDSDAAKDSTLKQIDKSIKDVDASVKSGTSTLAGILESIKSAIQGIPGGGSGSGNGSGEGEGEGGEGSVQECPEETCQFGERDPFDGEEVPTYQESLEKIFDGLKNSPIGQSLTSISFPSGGSCPTANMNIEVMKQNIPINFSSHCDLWEHIAPFLRAAFLAFWALLAIRVFLSA